jgi:hypothetical protein
LTQNTDAHPAAAAFFSQAGRSLLTAMPGLVSATFVSSEIINEINLLPVLHGEKMPAGR